MPRVKRPTNLLTAALWISQTLLLSVAAACLLALHCRAQPPMLLKRVRWCGTCGTSRAARSTCCGEAGGVVGWCASAGNCSVCDGLGWL